MANATFTLAISKELKKELGEIKGVNWSEETRRFLEERVKRVRLLRQLDELTKNSDLTEEDVLEIGRKINAEIAKKHGIVN
ncbi:MAG: hypothetical protein Q7R47_00115 [Candidatus Diapherotrites archaeon]|nr:hypothetical protein [Candidatus Diapherotrites archaeon]